MINITVTTESTKGNMVHLNASRDVRGILPVGDTLFLVILTISHVIRTHRLTTMNGRGQISLNIHLVATCNVSNPEIVIIIFISDVQKAKKRRNLICFLFLLSLWIVKIRYTQHTSFRK